MKQTELAEYRSAICTSSKHGDYNWLFVAKRLLEHIGELEDELYEIHNSVQEKTE